MRISNCDHLRAVRRFIKNKSRVYLSQTEKYIQYKNLSILTLWEKIETERESKSALILCTSPLGTSKD